MKAILVLIAISVLVIAIMTFYIYGALLQQCYTLGKCEVLLEKNQVKLDELNTRLGTWERHFVVAIK